MDKSRSIPRNNLSYKSTRIEKPSKIDISNDYLGVSVLSGQGEILSNLKPDILQIPRNNKRERNSKHFNR